MIGQQQIRMKCRWRADWYAAMIQTTAAPNHIVEHASARRRRGACAGGGLLVALLLVMASFACSAQAASVLGRADGFAVLAGSTVTNIGPSLIRGDVGVSPGSSVTGFGLETVVAPGTVHAADAMASDAQADLAIAYDGAARRTSTSVIAGDLAGRTLVPGVYSSASAVGLNGVLTLDARGDPDAVFVVQARSDLLVGSGAVSDVRLIGGAQACHVFWQVASSATIGPGSSFSGTILARTSISLKTGATLNGRALAQHGAVTLDTNTITKPACATTAGPVAPPGGVVPPGLVAPPAKPKACTVASTQARPSRPVLRSPRRGARVRAGNVRFRWRGSARTSRYTLIVDRKKMNTGCATSAVMPIARGQHRWRVIAAGPGGTRSSSLRAFSASGNCRQCIETPKADPAKSPKTRPKTKNPGRRTCKSPGRNPSGKYGYLVYEANKNGRVVYVGISRSFRARCAAHRRAASLLADLFGAAAGKRDGIFALSHLNFLSYSEARQVEQVLIEKYGLGSPNERLTRISIPPAGSPASGSCATAATRSAPRTRVRTACRSSTAAFS